MLRRSFPVFSPSCFLLTNRNPGGVFLEKNSFRFLFSPPKLSLDKLAVLGKYFIYFIPPHKRTLSLQLSEALVDDSSLLPLWGVVVPIPIVGGVVWFWWYRYSRRTQLELSIRSWGLFRQDVMQWFFDGKIAISTLLVLKLTYFHLHFHFSITLTSLVR